MMDYPSLRAYVAAIANNDNINIPFFKSQSVKIYLNRRGLPYMSTGGFGAAFRFKDKQGKEYCLKVFTRESPGREERYRALHDTLQVTNKYFDFMVDFQYVSEGLKVGTSYFPVVVMEWGKGLTLAGAIENDLAGNGKLDDAPIIGGNLFRIVRTLQDWKIGHGDLQEANLLVSDENALKLIDYDGMFVPAVMGQKSFELGQADYQHPKRKQKHFGPFMDDFALIALLFQLAIIDGSLWKANHEDIRLVLKHEDYAAPKKSAIIKMGLKSDVPHTRALAELLVEACHSDPMQIGAVASIEANPTIMNWFAIPQPTESTDLKSIIGNIVALNSEQVQAFEASAVASEQDSPPARRKQNDEGSWGLLKDLFFEDTGESPSTPVVSGGVPVSIKKSLLNLFFEEVPDPAADPVPHSAPPTAKPTVGESQVTQAKQPEAPFDPKTARVAPLPEWMKKRRK